MVDRNDLLSKLGLVDRGAVIQKGKDSTAVAQRADFEEEAYGLDSLLHAPYKPNNGNPRYTDNEFNALDDDDQDQKIKEGFNFRLITSLKDAVSMLSRNTDDVLKDGGNYHPELANVSGEAVEHADRADRKVLGRHAIFNTYRRIVDNLIARRDIELSEENEIKIASEAAYKMQYDHFKSLGYTDRDANASAKLAIIAPSEEIPYSYLLAGAIRMRDKAERGLQRAYGNNYQEVAAQAVGKTIEKLVNSGDSNKEKKATDLFYRAHRDKSIGERDFNEVFP